MGVVSSSKAKSANMKNRRSRYLVYAELHGFGKMPSAFDEDKAGRPVERRLNRIERVVAAYRGQIDARLRNGLRSSFDSADAALLGACEMQHRCSVLPQFSANRVALRIGLHHEAVRQRAKDSADNAAEIAQLLAALDDQIVASEMVVGALNPELRVLVGPIHDLPGDVSGHTIDWRREIPPGAYGGEALWPVSRGPRASGAYLLLHLGMKTIELTRDNPVATIGREASNDLVIADDHVSRNHCRIERRVDGFVLTDSSTNGTCVTPDTGEETLIKNDSFALRGQGLLFFGRLCNGERRGGVRYEIY